MKVEVLLKAAQVRERGRTVRAFEPFLSGVTDLVCKHILLARESFRTEVALERSQAGVCHHVTFQVPGSRELPSTHVTIQFSWLLV